MSTLAEYKMQEPDNNQVEGPESPEETNTDLIEEVDDLGVDIPDIPLPSTEDAAILEIEDEFEGAYKFAVVGVGQGGSRLAETFWKLGYRRVAVINTAAQDLKPISLPEENKLLIGGSGAGKNREKARLIFEEHREDILDFLKNTFQTGIDRVLVCIGAGGGTGAGGGPIVVDICHDLCQTVGAEQSHKDAKVGAVLALPSKSEGSRVKNNAKETADALIEYSTSGTLSPLIILDNERIRHLYPKLSVNKFWNTANTSICSLFHLFNKIAAQDSEYTAFDKADISHAVRDNLKKNILANIDVNTGNVAACVVIGDKGTLDHTPQESLEHGFEQLTRLLGEGSTVHRGIYHTSKKGLVVYTIIGGIEAPEQLFS